MPSFKNKGIETYSKALIILSAYLIKLNIPEFLKNDLNYILKIAPNILEVNLYFFEKLLL